MFLTALLLIVVGISFAWAGIQRAFRALSIDPLELLVFFGIAETVEQRGPRLVPRDGLDRAEPRLPRAGEDPDGRRTRSAA